MKLSRKHLSLAGLGLVATLPSTARAGGIQLYEIATPDLGLASAGYSTRAQDASTLFKNPAGMSLLQDPQLQAGVQLLYGHVQFSPDSNTSPRLGTDNGGNAVGALPGLSLFYVQPLGERWRVGLGMFSNFGLAQKYEDDWVGRYYVQESALIGVSVMPSVSFKVTDWLSVGAGLNAMSGYLRNQVAINNLEPALGDGQMKIEDSTWGFGANAGILIEPRKGTRFGFTYLSRVNLDFADTPSFSNLGPGLAAVVGSPQQLNLGLTVPQSVMVGAYHEFNDRFALMADVGWQDWSQFGEVEVGVASATSPNLTTDLNYQDTWHVALGAQYKLSEKWHLTSGFAYDSSAVSDGNRSVVLPMGQAFRFGVGARWQVSQAINLGAAYELLWSGDLSVDQGSDTALRGRVAGSYDNTSFNFFTLNMTWKF